MGIAGDDQLHVWQDPHDGDLLQGLVGGSVRADRQTTVGPGQLDIQIGIADGGPYLVPGPPGQKDTVGGDERDLSGQRQASGHPQHVLLGDADIEESFGIFLGKPAGQGGF